MSIPTSSGAVPDGAFSESEKKLQPVPHTRVSISDGFWSPRLETNRTRTIPFIYEQLKNTQRLNAFLKDWQPTPEIAARNSWGGTPVMFWDSDVAKWFEAASYSLATNPDPALDELLDEVIAMIAQDQEPDGYLNTWFTRVDPKGRFINLRDWHELYNAGHLIEAAVAHYEATGKTSFLNIIRRYVDLIDSKFGPEPGQKRGYCGHPEIELALIKLWKATREDRYLKLARYFVNERGQQPNYYEQEAEERGESRKHKVVSNMEYHQAHKPVREQTEVTGHAVRAVYLYSAMADLAGIDGDGVLLEACRKLWTHLTTKRMYVMAGIGSSAENEGFTNDYDLPNEKAYAETCAAIGLIFWASRMLQLDLDHRYGDIMELALYNAVLSGISADGQGFFYENPLASNGTHHREEWFECPCCPPNLARLFASLGGYIYSESGSEAVIHLYIQGHGQLDLGGRKVVLHQTADYPWDGRIIIRVELDQPGNFALKLRLPGWCDVPQLAVNGEAVSYMTGITENGYARLDREWQNGDTVTLELPMPVERVYAHPEIAADTGKVALQRGPLVYCLEQVDFSQPLHTLSLAREADLTHHFEPETVGGLEMLGGRILAASTVDWENTLYRTTPPGETLVEFRAVPYFAWDERGAGKMEVWIREK